MDVKPTELERHASGVNGLLREVSRAPQASQLVRISDLSVITQNSPVSRQVVTDLGATEYAIPIRSDGSAEPGLWIGVHERWVAVNKRRVRFSDCGLRLYSGGSSEDAVQVLRLEWVAPEVDEDGVSLYQGKHAGHPHWHIDRAALAGPETYWASLEALTLPSPIAGEIEEFSGAVAATHLPDRRVVQDCSWLHRVHLPARAQWADVEWNGTTVPGPHQSEPESVESLERWWAGALRYLAAELL
jgi:hypothetical protein